MAAIHLIRNNPGLPAIQPIAARRLDFFSSGFWSLAENTARRLLGGKIYFHRRQKEPSYFGGTITEVRIQQGGKYDGRIVFTLRGDDSCRGVLALNGWAREMRIDIS